MKSYALDQGKGFGKWPDAVSRLMYQTSTELFFGDLDFSDLHVADYGGANGLLGTQLKCRSYTVVDKDSSKVSSPVFINEDILTHKGGYDVIILRYVMHYLSDINILYLLKHIMSFHKGQLYIMQFTNEGVSLEIKKSISKHFEQGPDGRKYFRGQKQLTGLFNVLPPRTPVSVSEVGYRVTEQFYRNRFGLNIVEPVEHRETVRFYRYDL